MAVEVEEVVVVVGELADEVVIKILSLLSVVVVVEKVVVEIAVVE